MSFSFLPPPSISLVAQLLSPALTDHYSNHVIMEAQVESSPSQILIWHAQLAILASLVGILVSHIQQYTTAHKTHKAPTPSDTRDYFPPFSYLFFPVFGLDRVQTRFTTPFTLKLRTFQAHSRPVPLNSMAQHCIVCETDQG